MLHCRRATLNDLPSILRIIRSVVPLMHAVGNFQWENDYPNEAVFRQDIERQHLWMAEAEGRIVGVAAITTDQDPEYAQADWDNTLPALVTHRLAVDPTVQGQGIAVALLQQAEKVALEQNLPVYLPDETVFLGGRKDN
jgi:GNAT superfamily N-acetyltransferase